MITLTQNQSFQRWDTLPDNLREALYLEANSDFVWKTCTDEHIPENKIREVAKVAGYVLMGFLHPEDVAQELKERLGLDTQTANSIEAALNKRIFAPLRPDIDKIYAPISKLEKSSATTSPKIIQDVSVAPPKAAVQPLPAVGWSQMKPPAPAAPVPPTPPRAAAMPTSTPIAATPAEPAPVMLHEDTTFKAAQKNVDFTLTRPGSGAEMHMGSGAVPPPPKPAVLEFGGAPKTAAAPAGPSGAVHYTDFKPPLSTAPTASAGSRNVVQITPSAPAPSLAPSTTPKPLTSVPVPQPPRPPQPPTPPAPSSAPQNNKPIVKDFL